METETEAQKAAIKHLGDVITEGEAIGGSYGSWNSGTYRAKNSKGQTYNKVGHSGVRDLSTLTIDQLIAAGQRPDARDENRIRAAGKYQIITPTLIAAKKELGLKGNEKFTNDEQEYIFEQYLIGPTSAPRTYKYIHKGIGTSTDAQYDIAKVWRSVEVPEGYQRAGGTASNGHQSYADDGNKVKYGIGAKVRVACEQARDAFAGKTTTQTTQTTQTQTQTKPKTTTKDPDSYKGYQLTGSVGAGGDNKYDDVVAVQTRLHFYGIACKVDGACGAETIRAIKAFQRVFKLYDGLIDVGKRTQRELFAGSITVEAKLDQPATDTKQQPQEKQRETKQTEQKQTQQQKQQPQQRRTDGMYTVGGYPSSVAAGNKEPIYTGSIVSGTLPNGIRVRAGVEMSPAILRGAKAAAPYLPRGTEVTSGIRTDDHQARVIIQKAGGLVDGDLWKSYVKANGGTKAREVAWVGNSNHRAGRAFDLAGAPFSQIVAAVAQARQQHPEAKLHAGYQERQCVHVAVDE